MSVFLASMEGKKECGLVALSTNNGFVVHNRNLGGTPSDALISQNAIAASQNRIFIDRSRCEAVDDASQARRS